MTTERENPLIGRAEYTVVNNIGVKAKCMHTAVKNLISDRKKAYALEFKMHQNTASSGSEWFGNDRPSSAFFSIQNDKVIVEWGKVNLKNEAKLHDFLRENIDYKAREDGGGIVRSGHICEIWNQDRGLITRVALFDCFSSDQIITEQRPEYPMVMTLLANGIVPITSDAYPVRIDCSH